MKWYFRIYRKLDNYFWTNNYCFRGTSLHFRFLVIFDNLHNHITRHIIRIFYRHNCITSKDLDKLKSVLDKAGCKGFDTSF